MSIIHHYLTIKETYHIHGSQPFHLSLEQLAGALCCSTRNTKLILKQCSERGWLDWKPGRGRGRLSTLTLLAEPAHVLLPLIQALITKGQYPEAMKLMQQYAPLSSGIADQVLASVYRQLGVRSSPHPSGTEGSGMDVLRLPFYRELPCLDPIYAFRRTELHLIGQLFDTLVDWDGTAGRFTPRLAFQVDCLNGGKEWMFHLRKGVFFHNTRVCTAEDVRHSLLRLLASAGGNDSTSRAAATGPWRQLAIRSIDVLHPYVLRVRLDSPGHLLLPFLAAPQASIVPLEAGADFGRYPVGTGPFRLLRNDAEMIVLEAFTDYYRERAQLDRIEMWIIKRLLTENATDELLGGKPQLYAHPFQIHPSRDLEQVKTIERIEGGCTFLLMNARKPGPLQSPELRRSLRSLLSSLYDAARLGGQRLGPATSFFPDWSNSDAGAISSPAAGIVEAEAAAHLSKPLQLVTHPILNRSLEETALWIKRECAKQRIPIDIRVLPYEEIRQTDTAQHADLLLLNAVTTANREWSLMQLLLDERTGIFWRLPSEHRIRLEACFTALAEEESPSVRQLLTRELESVILSSDTIHILYHLRQVSIPHPALLGAERINPYGWANFAELALRPQ
ncbi:ABC transporter substrate-binding protein [Paenibacillus puerhi]|uniref:ABC transporter substrate-binding protein n=1 Tax=Paenibacillus puerhi TaxID=2692622 RepID=UPI00135B61CB|nr:ABC transporter substrate-binding protein [Paenibacillus puerhi]